MTDLTEPEKAWLVSILMSHIVYSDEVQSPARRKMARDIIQKLEH